MNIYRITPRAQRGMVLIIGLLLVLVLTIGVMLSMQLINVEMHVATNMHNEDVAFQTTEGAIKSAEIALAKGNYTAFSANAAGLYTLKPTSDPVWAPWAASALDWSGSNALQTTFSGHTGTYVIEQLPSVAKKGNSLSSSSYGGGAVAQTHVYRITTHSVGPDGKRAVLLQTVIHD